MKIQSQPIFCLSASPTPPLSVSLIIKIFFCSHIPIPQIVEHLAVSIETATQRQPTMPTHFRWNSRGGLHMPPISISLLEKLQIKKAHGSSTTNLVNLPVYWEVLIPLYLIIVIMKGKKFTGGNTKYMLMLFSTFGSLILENISECMCIYEFIGFEKFHLTKTLHVFVCDTLSAIVS